jgi:single-stranded DNA-binding protein
MGEYKRCPGISPENPPFATRRPNRRFVNFRLRPSLLPAKRRIKEEVCFIDIVAFGRVAERSKTFLQNAPQVLVTPAQPKTLGKRGR